MVLRPALVEQLESDAGAASAVGVFADWLEHASRLLLPGEVDLNAAHNKVKHGLAVRARSDIRTVFVAAPLEPDGEVRLSDLTGENAFDIFDRPVLEFVDRGPRQGGVKQGLELTQVRLDAAALLAEGHMMAWTHAALFWVAAERHFAGRTLPDHFTVAPHPGLPVGGPHPRHIAAAAPIGLRFPITTPPGGGEPQRGAGLALRDCFVPMTFGPDSPVTRTISDG